MDKFRFNLIVILLLFAARTGSAQSSIPTLAPETAAVQAKIASFFTAMYEGDTTTLRMLFAQKARLFTIISQSNIGTLADADVNKFIKAVGEPKDEKWLEVIWSYTIEVEGEIASAWCPFSFFLEQDGIKQIMYCGVNSIELFKGPAGWQISQITDMRTEGDCREE